RECVHVYRRYRFLHDPKDVEVGLAGEARMDTPLEAYLRGASIGSLARAGGDFRQVEVVRRAAQIRRAAALREGTEAAMIKADVGVVDIAIDDIAHDVANPVTAQLIRGLDDHIEIAAFGAEQADDIRFIESAAAPSGRNRLA